MSATDDRLPPDYSVFHPNAFISSTLLDLPEHRKQAREAAWRCGFYAWAMEKDAAISTDAVTYSLELADKAHVYIGVFGFRYGTIRPPFDCSITELEVRQAMERGIPILLFYMHEGHPVRETDRETDPERLAKLQALKAELRLKYVPAIFHSPEELGRQVFESLSRLKETGTFEKQALAVLQSNRPQPPLAAQRHEFYDRRVPLLDYLVERTAELAEVRDALLQGKSSSIAITSAVTVRATALHGMGGIGKSVLARTLCDDVAIHQLCPDGILWTTLGEHPEPAELVAKLRDWVTALGGAIPGAAPSIDLLQSTLRTLLKDQVYLLVIDDVWQRSHLDQFRVGGPKCRVLFTTRNASIADEVGADIVRVPLMSEGEAVGLLEWWAHGALENLPLAQKKKLANRLGRLPLALRLAGPQLRHQGATDWLTSFDALKLQLGKKTQSDDIHDSLETTFELSLQAVPEDSRLLLFALAVFKEDEAIPTSAVQRLWKGLQGLDAQATHDLMRALQAQALIDVLKTDTADLLTLHDLMRELLKVRLGSTTKQAHDALLAGYRAVNGGLPWQLAKDDGYLYDHLAYHLKAIGAYDELMSLFADDQWLQKRVAERGYTYDGYISDLADAWSMADAAAQRAIASGDAPQTLADSVHCLLIRSSINSIAENYEPELIVQAVQAGLWTLERALSVAARVPNARKRVEIYLSLLSSPHLDVHQRERTTARALDVVEFLPDERERTWLKAAMDAQFVAGLDAYLVEQACAGLNVYQRAERLHALASYLPPKQTEQVFTSTMHAALALPDDGMRAETLRALAPHLPPEQVQQAWAAALQATLELPDEYVRTQTLQALAPHLPPEQAHQAWAVALQAALELPDEYSRTHILQALAPQLPPEQAIGAFKVALTLSDDYQRARTIAALAQRITADQAVEVWAAALQATLKLPDEYWRALTLQALAPLLPPEQAHQAWAAALQAALKLPDEYVRTQILQALAPQLPPEQLQQALQAALRLPNGYQRAKTLQVLAPHLSAKQAQQAWAAALQAALRLPNGYQRAQTLQVLAPHLSAKQAQQAWAAALRLPNGYQRTQILQALAPQLPPEQAHQAWAAALQAALALPDEYSRTQTLQALAPQLPPEQAHQARAAALQTALKLPDGYQRAQTLQALAPHLPPEQAHQAWAAALQAALALPDEYSRTQTLQALAPQVLPEQAQQAWAAALQTALALPNEYSRAQRLQALAPLLPPEQAHQAWAAALQAALALPNGSRRAQRLQALAPQLHGKQVEVALRAVWNEFSGIDQVFLYFAVRAHLTEDEVSSALRQATIEHTSQQLLKKEQLDSALEAVLSISDTDARAKAAATQAVFLSPEQAHQVLALLPTKRYSQEHAWFPFALHLQVPDEHIFLALTQSLQDKGDLQLASALLAAIAPQLTQEQTQQVLEIALSRPRDTVQTRLLLELAPQLDADQAERAFESALPVNSSEATRTYLLAALMPRLSLAQREWVFKAVANTPETTRAWVLVQSAPSLSPQQYQWPLKSALALQDDTCRSYVLVHLIPYLTPWQRTQVLNATESLHRDKERAWILLTLASSQGTPDRDAVRALITELLAADTTHRGSGDIFSALLHLHLLQTLCGIAKSEPALYSYIQRQLMHVFAAVQTLPRREILTLLSVSHLFTPVVVPQNWPMQVTKSILQICEEWQWL